MSLDYGIRISKDGSDADALGNVFADRQSLLMNMRDPMAKLDTTNPVSFQNISLTFNTDPPEPTGAGEEKETVVYQFAHGYTYSPTVWTLAQVTQRPTTPGTFYQNFFQTVGVIKSTTAADFAALQMRNDNQYVYISVRKGYNAGLGGTPQNIVGCKILIRIYVFVEDYNNEQF